ncbi:MAG TPA: hypothetical protein VMB74_04375 [Streptosporangiaceae bacterium]|nr:hypothetical protein [Streptosporangiaceae bacterium]
MGKRPAGKAALLISGAAVIAGCGRAPAPVPYPSPVGTTTAAGYYSAQVASSGEHRATLAIDSGATTLTVTAAAIPGSLLRTSAPGNSSLRPQLVSSPNQVQLSLLSTGQRGPSAVSVQLSTAVTWQLEFNGGTSQTVLNLTNGQVAGLDFEAGSGLIQIALPRPSGAVMITLGGGASQVSLTVPGGVPIRLRLDAGASAATLAGQAHLSLSRGTVLSSPGWAEAANKYDVDAPAGIGEISVVG